MAKPLESLAILVEIAFNGPYRPSFPSAIPQDRTVYNRGSSDFRLIKTLIRKGNVLRAGKGDSGFSCQAPKKTPPEQEFSPGGPGRSLLVFRGRAGFSMFAREPVRSKSSFFPEKGITKCFPTDRPIPSRGEEPGNGRAAQAGAHSSPAAPLLFEVIPVPFAIAWGRYASGPSGSATPPFARFQGCYALLNRHMKLRLVDVPVARPRRSSSVRVLRLPRGS